MREIELFHSSWLNFPTNEGLLEALCLSDLKIISRITTLREMGWILTNKR